MKLCECGCGQPAPIAKQSDTRLGYVKGGPKRFIAGHQSRVQFPPPEERFWASVQKTDGCWLWTGPRDKDGYGIFHVDGKNIKAHRYSYELHRGPIPEGLWGLHKCDNPPCVRPDHLYAGTHIDNVNDAVERGRVPTGDRNGSRIHPEKRPRGDQHWARQVSQMPTRGAANGRAKISESDVRKIRSLYATGKYSQSRLGEMFGLTQSGVGSIVNRRAWNHIE